MGNFLFLIFARQDRGQDDFPFQEPADPDEIIDSTDCAVEVGVFRFAAFSLAVIHINFINFQTCVGEHGREESMHSIEGNQKIDVVAVDRFEGASRVADSIVDKPAAHRVGNPRGQFPAEGVLTLRASTDRDVAVTTANQPEKLFDVRRVILTIAICPRLQV